MDDKVGNKQMRIVMIACSRGAYQLMQNLKDKWLKEEPDIEMISKIKCSRFPEISMQQSVSECVKEWFDKTDAIVFFSATGIAVRSIAPCLNHKSTDPAVVVVDETGKFSISLLSGHTGGANEMAEKIASLLGAVPVITTATDQEGKFAVDDYARKHDLVVTDWKLAKEISAAVLEGEQIGLCIDNQYSSFGKRDFAEGILQGVHFYQEEAGTGREKRGIQISCLQVFQPPFPTTLQLVPKLFVIGVGCKKDTEEEKIAKAVKQCLKEKNIRLEAVYAVASIDIKKQERGIISFCKKEEIPFLTFSAKELQSIKGTYSESSFVEQITGVSNVCERSAVAAAGGRLIYKKKVYNGVTLAIAVCVPQ